MKSLVNCATALPHLFGPTASAASTACPKAFVFLAPLHFKDASVCSQMHLDASAMLLSVQMTSTAVY